MHWLFYTQQVRLLGVELPSPSTASLSSAGASPEPPELPVSTPASTAKLLPAAAMAAAAAAGASAQLQHDRHAGAAGSGRSNPGPSRGAMRSLGPSFGLSTHGRAEQQPHQQQDSEQEQSPDKQPGKFAKSAKLMLSAGLVSLTERLSEALSPTKAARQEAAGAAPWPDSPRRATFGGFELQQQQQQHEGATLRQKASALISPLRLGVRSISAPGADPPAAAGAAAANATLPGGGGGSRAADSTAGTQLHTAHGLAAKQPASVRRPRTVVHSAAQGVSRDATLNVPLTLQASFIDASRSQRLRRRWLMVKAFNRYAMVF